MSLVGQTQVEKRWVAYLVGHVLLVQGAFITGVELLLFHFVHIYPSLVERECRGTYEKMQPDMGICVQNIMSVRLTLGKACVCTTDLAITKPLPLLCIKTTLGTKSLGCVTIDGHWSEVRGQRDPLYQLILTLHTGYCNQWSFLPTDTHSPYWLLQS